MKTRLIYLLVIFTMLLSACSVARAASSQPVAPAEQNQAAPTENAQAQGQPVDGKLPPKEALAGRAGIVVMVVVTAFAKGQHCQPDIVAAVVAGVVAATAPDMAQRVDRESDMV